MSEPVVIFDMDGTLTASGEGVMNAGTSALTEMGLPVPPRSELRTMVGPPLGDSFLRFGVPAERVEEAISRYRVYYQAKGKFECELYPGIPELLKALNAAGCALYIATSKPEPLSKDILGRFGILGEFRFVAGATQGHERETKTEVLEYLFDTIGRPERALMIGDTDCDVIGARDVGLRCVGVGWGYGSVDAMKKEGAIAIAGTAEELREIVFTELSVGETGAEARVTEELASVAEPEYAAFIAKLNPSVPAERILGVRLPALRACAKKMDKPLKEAFLAALPHKTYEGDLLHAILLSGIRDADAALRETERFAPYIDNWAVCDTVHPKALLKKPEATFALIRRLVADERPFVRRIGVDYLMHYGLDEHFSPECNELAASAENGEYYTDIAVAWYFATALAKQWEATLPVLTENRLSEWTHNKTIQKAIESYRITDEQKAYLRELKRK